MENHPIPQDITGFKFRLIGSMTVRQFLYLLAAGILDIVVLLTKGPFLVKAPLFLLFSLFGFVLAFVPIEGRPAEKMFSLFVLALFSENIYVYRKQGLAFLAESAVGKKVEAKKAQPAPLPMPVAKMVKKEDEEEKLIEKIKPLFEETVFEQKVVADEKPKEEKPASMPAPETPETLFLEKKQKALEGEIEKAKEEAKEKGEALLEEKIKQLEEELVRTLREKEELEKKLLMRSYEKQTPVFRPSKQTEMKETENVKTVAPSSAVSAGFPKLPDVPNIVLGVVKDPRGHALPDIIVEVLDENNIPVRAFKTNTLGQFMSATPLANGTYKVVFHDPQKKHDFDTILIELNGTIFSPLEVRSVDEREKLRRELFGQ